MKKFDELTSVDDISYSDYLDFKNMLEAKNQKIVGKTEILYLLPFIIGLLSFALTPISPLFLLLSIPVCCIGAASALIAGKSIYVNFCKKADNKVQLQEYQRLKKVKKLANISNLIKEFQKLDRFAEEQLQHEILALKGKIKSFSQPSYEKEKVVGVLEHDLQKKQQQLKSMQNKNSEIDSVANDELGLDI